MTALGQMITIIGGKSKPLKVEFTKIPKEFQVFKNNSVNNLNHKTAY